VLLYRTPPGIQLSMMQLFFLALVSASTVSENPISKVIQLLVTLQEQVTKEGEVEKKQFEEFGEWCETNAVTKQHEIKDGKAAVEREQAVIAKETATIGNLESQIAQLASTIATNAADLKAATEIREKEAADFAKADADLAETIDMLGRAIGIISKNMKGGSFVQGGQALQSVLAEVINAAVLQTQDKAKLESLIQQSQEPDDFLSRSAPAPKGYENHSGGILETLEDMKEKAAKMRHEGQTAEMTNKHNFELLAQSLNDAMKNDEKIKAEAGKNKSVSEEAKSLAEGALAAAQKELAEDEKALKIVQTDCQTKAADFQESMASRDAELEALRKALEIIQSSTGPGAARAYGLLQTNQKARSTKDASDRVVSMLAQLQKQTGDSVLAQLSMRVKAALSSGAADGADPFAKVKGLIQDMIEKLVADAAAEASHKAFCDKEMAESEDKIADHTAHIEKYTARKDKAVASIERLTGEIAQLQADLAQIAKLQAEMNKMREEEKAAFAVAKKEYEDGIEGLSGALQLLRDYYSEGESFVQADQPSVGTHSKASGEATGIIGMLEVAESDFTKLLSEATVAEESAQREYDKVSQENEVATAMKKTSAAGKETEVKETKSRVGELESDISAEQTELDAVNEYYDKLKPACIAKPEPYAERKRRREAEIAGLKEALSILEGLDDDSFLAVRTVRRHLH